MSEEIKHVESPFIEKDLEDLVLIFDKLNQYCIAVNPKGDVTKEGCKDCFLCNYKHLDPSNDCTMCLYAYALVNFTKKGGLLKNYNYS